jgi:EAL domain-containing protein (putative c-di-GMP-specific phosphodiesterase class I)
VRLFSRRIAPEECLVWSRDERFVHRLAELVPDARVVVLASGAALTGPADQLPDAIVAKVAGSVPHGVVRLDPSKPEPERSLVALAEAIQQSRIADRVGMTTSANAARHHVVDMFIARREVVEVRYQPIVALDVLTPIGFEALCRPSKLVGSITSVVEAAVATGRTLELDRLMVDVILTRTAALDPPIPHVTINVLPASLADPSFEARGFAHQCRAAGVDPSVVTLECTEQQTAPDVAALARRVARLRAQGFGFAIDDAGAGYASFALIATLRPSVIKIDREIVRGIATDDARQALVEAFVGFARRVDALLVAEGIQRRDDLQALRALGVHYGQGYLLGRPQVEPQRTRRARARALPGEAWTGAPLAVLPEE